MGNQIKSGAVLSYLSIFLGSCISIVYTPIMLRLLGQSEYGLMTLSNSVVGYLSLLNLGLGSAMVRYISKFKAQNDEEKEFGVITLFAKFFLVISLLMLAGGVVLILNAHYFFDKALTPTEFYRLKILMALMTFNMAIGVNSSVFYAVMMAYEKFVFTKLVGIINTVLTPAIMLPLLLLGYKSVGMTIATTLLNVLNVVIISYYCFRILKIRFKKVEFDSSFYKELFAFSFYIIFAMIVDKVYWSTDQLILGAVVGTSAVAVYNVGSNFTTYFMSFSTAISGMFLPRLTEMTTKGATDADFSNLFIKVGRVQYLILSYILVAFLVFGKQFIVLWAGPDYDWSFYVAISILFPFVIPLIQNIGLQLMYARNQHKFRSIMLFIIAIMNVTISIPIARVYGGIGCAMVTGISFILGQGLVLNWFYQRKMHLDMYGFWKNIIQMSWPMAVVAVMAIGIETYLHITGWGLFLLNAVIYTLLYAISMWLFVMNNYEKELIKGFLKKSKK